MPDSVTPAQLRMVALATSRHGIVDHLDLRSLGVPRQTVAGWAASGRIHRIHEGVYSIVPPSMLTWEGRHLAAGRACGPNAAISHGPAGQAHGIVSRRERLALHVSLRDRSRRRVPGIVIHRPRVLESCDLTRFAGIPVTTASRAIWDMTWTHTPRQVRRAFEQAEMRGVLDRGRLNELLRDMPLRKGSKLIRILLADRVVPLAEVRSWLEELLMTICADNALPFPAVNVPLLGYEVDFLWEGARFVVETDGRDHLNPRRRDSDNERDFTLGRAGFLVRRYSSRAMEDERAVVAEVLGILRDRPGQRRPDR